MPKADRITAASVSVASAGNSELTIIMIAADEALRLIPYDGRARQLLLDIRASALRLAWANAGMLRYSELLGGKPTSASIDAITSNPITNPR